MRYSLTEWTGLWEDLQSLLEESAKILAYDGKNRRESAAVLLYYRTVALCQEAISALTKGGRASSPIIVRAALEGYIDLCCIVRESDYLITMEYRWLRDQVHLHEARPPANMEVAKKVRKRLKEVSRHESARDLKIAKRFELAGCSDLYKSFYAELCRHTHNSVDILAQQHVIETGDGYRIGFFLEMTREEVDFVAHCAISLGISALEEIMRFLEVADTELVEALAEIRLMSHSALG